MEHVFNQLEREIYGTTLNKPKWFKKEFSLHLMEFKV
jgi:hypothetical protein